AAVRIGGRSSRYRLQGARRGTTRIQRGAGMTATRTRHLVRRVVASTAVSLVIAFGLVRAFAMGGTATPPDRAAAFVPKGALVYLNLSNQPGSAQWKRATGALDKLPSLGGLRATLLSLAQGQGALAKLDYKPWLGN